MIPYTSAKCEVLRYVERLGLVDFRELANALGYATRGRQRHASGAYVDGLSSKGASWLSWYEAAHFYGA